MSCFFARPVHSSNLWRAHIENPDVMMKSGQGMVGGRRAHEYNFTDIDGKNSTSNTSEPVVTCGNVSVEESHSMKPRSTERTSVGAFEIVRTVGLALPDVEGTTKYDGSPLLKLGGIFMAGLATHPSAEPDTLVVRHGFEEREWLIEDAPQTYYLTEYYRRYPLVLVRLSRIEPSALRDVLSVSWRLTAMKARKRY